MTCEDTNGDCSECGECAPLSSEIAVSRSIDFAVNILYELDTAIDKDQNLENVTVTVNAARLASVCDSLLSYAENYDDVDVKELFEMCSAVQEHSSVINTHSSNTVH